MITPINTGKLELELLGHPERSVADYVLTGLRNGFRLGFNPAAVSLSSASQNISSALLQPEVIDNGKRLNSWPFPHTTSYQPPYFGVIRIKHQPAKWRVILDISTWGQCQ